MTKIACLLLRIYVRRENTQTGIQLCFNLVFITASQKSNLNRKIYVFRLISVVWMSPCLSLQLGLSKNLMRVSSRTCSRTYCGCLRTSLRTFIAPIWMRIVTTNLKLQSVISKDISNTIIYSNKSEYCPVFIKRLVF